jgi:toxin ParE1/3/4
MGQVIQSPEARSDLIEIWLYIAQNNQDAADRLITAIDEKLNLLSDSPQMGQAREELTSALRSFPVGKYLLFYRPIPGGIELVRVVHGARDIKSLFE